MDQTPIRGGYILTNDAIVLVVRNESPKKNEELKDYKFMCFGGRVKCIFTVTERFSDNGLKVTFFDTNWNLLSFERHYSKSTKQIPKPYNLEKMIYLAEVLSHGIPFVRVDFYESGGKIFFGELTFYPGGGYEEFTPEEWDYTLGSWIDIHNVCGTFKRQKQT